jgi:hypothetical protein
MHEVTSSHWHEPEGTKNAGYGAWNRPNTAYDDFMEAQGIRQEYEQILKDGGVPSQMDPSLYVDPLKT